MRTPEWLRSAVRPFRHAPIYALAVVGSLALAVAATTAAFAVVKRAFLDPLPFTEADGLVAVETFTDGRAGGMSIFVTEDLRKGPAFSALTTFRFSNVTYEAPGAAERLAAIEVTPAYFDVLGVAPALGSVWPGDMPDAVIVSWGFFERALSGEASAIGRRISIDGVPRTVFGVMPRGFMPPWSTRADVWAPLDLRPLLADTARARRTVTVIARLAAGISFETASAYMAGFSQDQRTRYPLIHARESWMIESLRDDLLGSSQPALVGTAVAAALLMVIVWANIAGLAVAQTAAERRALAVRAALGATSRRLFRERLVESLLLSFVGSVAGLWLGYALIAIAAGYQQQFLSNHRPISLELLTAALGLALGMFTGVISAIAPQHAISRLQGDDPLRNGRGSAGDARLTAVRSGLVVVQVAVAVVLIIAAGLLVRTVRNLSTTALGFKTEQLTTFVVTLPLPRYRESVTQVAFERDVLERIGRIQGVTSATASVGFPAAGAMGARMTILGRADGEVPADMVYFSVAPRFFSFLNVPILQGRDIAATDDFPAPRVVVINETMARMFWPNGDAIGARVKIGAGAATDREITIVGIAADVRQHGPSQDVRPTAYGSTLQYSWPRRHFSVRTAVTSATLAADLRAAIHGVDPLIGTPEITSVNEQLSQQTARQRLVMLSLSVLGLIATVLCGFGLYAVVALTSQFRRREYAIRVALGSGRGAVQWLVVRQSLMLAAGGATAGVVIASFVTTTLQGMLHGVEPVDRVTFTLAVAAVLVLAATASLIPAWKSGRVNPVDTLKAE